MEQIGIRRATGADAPQLESARARAISSSGIAWPPLVEMEARLAAPNVFTYLAEQASPFGFVTVGPPAENYFDDNRTGEILEWYLDDTHAGKGYGRKLLVHGLTVLRRRLRERAVIWIPAESARGIVALEMAGFERIDAETVSGVGEIDVRSVAFERDLGEFF